MLEHSLESTELGVAENRKYFLTRNLQDQNKDKKRKISFGVMPISQTWEQLTPNTMARIKSFSIKAAWLDTQIPNQNYSLILTFNEGKQTAAVSQQNLQLFLRFIHYHKSRSTQTNPEKKHIWTIWKLPYLKDRLTGKKQRDLHPCPSLLRKYCGANNAAVNPKNGLWLSAHQFSTGHTGVRTGGYKEFIFR